MTQALGMRGATPAANHGQGIGEVNLQQEVCLEGRLEWPSCHPLGQLGHPVPSVHAGWP